MTMSQPIKHHPASFRDPSGFVYQNNGVVYRFVSATYSENYELLFSSGLKGRLEQQGLLLPFTEIPENHTDRPDWYRTLLPEQIPFLNYAWEWSFEQLKDAALATLQICKTSLQHNMILKDATHLNLQYVKGKPVLIDHLSFEKYQEGTPWVAYRQFCECFLYPLLLSAYCHLEPHRLLTAWPGGIPADVTARLLPFTCRFRTSLVLHVFLPAKFSGHAAADKNGRQKSLPRKGLEQIWDNLESLIRSLAYTSGKIIWENYYQETILSKEYLAEKKEAVRQLLQNVSYETVLDLGANEGEFSFLCREDARVVATDIDSGCINELYKKIRSAHKTNILPLVVDLTQPAAARGWMHAEQPSFLSRAKAELTLALALIHHLCIGSNLSFQQVAELLAQCTRQLIIEFVPKKDPKVKEMLKNRTDIFDTYSQEQFELVFGNYFTIREKVKLQEADRTLYLMILK
jgi:ribosomal protein L11 methylase PrmA